MQIEFTHNGKELHVGTWEARHKHLQLSGNWEVSQYEDEFEFHGSFVAQDETEQELVNWIADSRETWLQLLRCPYTWRRLVFQEKAMIYEITEEDPVINFSVSAWTMLHPTHNIRYSAAFNRIEDVTATYTEIEAGIRWIIDEFCGNGHEDTWDDVEFAEQDDDPMIINDDGVADIGKYADVLGTELREHVCVLMKRYKEYSSVRSKIDWLYWIAVDMHRRQLVSHDTFDRISAALEMRDEQMLSLRSEEDRR